MSTEQPNDEQVSESPAPAEQASMVGAGRSLFAEVTKLREQHAELTKAVRALCTLMSVLDKKVDTALKGGHGADFAVM
jgi:hypothetical protein